MISCSLAKITTDRYDLFAEWGKGNAGEFHLLPGERNPDDRDRTHESGQEMSQGDPPAADHNPDDISDQGHRFHGCSLLPINHFPAERP